MRAGGLGGGPGQKAESKRKHFSVSTVGSPTKPLTLAVGWLVINRLNKQKTEAMVECYRKKVGVFSYS
jgi:hypothetical protein